MEDTNFTQPWYAHTIKKVLQSHPDASADAALQAEAILTAGVFIAEAIAESFGNQHDGNNIQSPLNDLVGIGERIAEAMESKSE